MTTPTTPQRTPVLPAKAPAPPPPMPIGAQPPVPAPVTQPVAPTKSLASKYPMIFNTVKVDSSGRPEQDPQGHLILTGPKVPTDAEFLHAVLGLPISVGQLTGPAAELREFFASTPVKK